MARRRRTKSKRNQLPDPQAVIEEQVEARLEDLFNLIHHVNPTGEKLPGREAARRYAQKNALQSLLIRRFGDEHLTVFETVRPGIVSLEHPSGARDACHAVIAELEPDARAWVRRRLDLAALRGEETEAVGERWDTGDRDGGDGAESVGELLERGRQALAEYDYEGGEELLRRAFDQSLAGASRAEHVDAAQALLELQVEILGLDEAALALEPRLAPAAREHIGVRTLLALAAARLGDAERALGLVAELPPAAAGLSLPRAAEVFAALTAAAIRGGDRRAAEGYLERLGEYDSTHPQIPGLSDEISRLRAEDFRAVEAELERRFRRHGAAAVEDEARALADRWPEGEVARRILRQAAAERCEAEIAERLELAAEARAEERFDDAARHYQAALDAGSERPDLPQLAAEARELARRQRERSAVAGVLDRFAELPEEVEPAGEAEDRRQALLAYLGLAGKLRAEVRDRVPRPVLGWLEELAAPSSGARAQAAVTAVLALERGLAAFERGAAQAAVDELEAERSMLRQVAAARALWQEARQRVVEERRRRGRETLEAARAALAEGRTAAARRLLDEVARGDLEDGDRSRAERLAAEIEDAEGIERLERDHGERLAAGDLAGALTRARQLAERTRGLPGDGHRRWSLELAELQGRLRATWELEVWAEETAVEEAPPPSHWRERSLAWLDDEGRELVLANTWDRWLFVVAIDVERRRITDRVSLSTPRPLGQPLITCRYGGSVWISGRDGDLIELARDGWDVLGFHPVAELVVGERSVDGALPLPGGRWVWMHVKGELGGDVNCVVDLGEWRVARRLTDGLSWFLPILGGGEPRFVRSGPRLAARLFDAAGEPLLSEPLTKDHVNDADLGPDGSGLLLLTHPGAGSDDDKGGREVVRLRQSADGEALRSAGRLEVPEAHPYGFHALVTSPERGLSFVLINTRDDGDELLVFSEPTATSSPERLEPIARAAWPGRATLVHDWRARHVAAVAFDGGGVELRFLGAEEPALAGLGEGRKRKGRRFPSGKVYSQSCGLPTGAVEGLVAELAAELEGSDSKALQTYLLRTELRETADVDEKVVTALALERRRHQDHLYKLGEELGEFARRLVRKHPRHAGAVLLLADLEAREERWAEVGRLLHRASPEGLDAGRARHFHHLEGLSHLHAGRLDKAFKAFRRGLAHDEGKCELEPLLAVAEPMAEPPKEGEWGTDQPPARRVVGAIRTADHALAAGDPEAARRALDRRDVRFELELQITARRAHAYLETAPPSTAGERFRERAALSFFLHVRQLQNYMRHELFLPGLHWDEERLEELEARVRARLGDGG